MQSNDLTTVFNSRFLDIPSYLIERVEDEPIIADIIVGAQIPKLMYFGSVLISMPFTAIASLRGKFNLNI